MTVREVTPVEVGQAYLELHHHLHRYVDRKMSCAGLSLARAKVLMRLTDQGPMNQATLASLLGFAPRSVTDTLDALEREGLVSRERDPNDRRAHIVALTPAGREAHERAQAVRSEAMTDVFGVLTATDRRRLADMCESIRSTVVPGECS